MKKQFYNQQEVMEILGASESSILRWRKEHQIPEPIKIGRKILGWPIDKFDKWLEFKMAS